MPGGPAHIPEMNLLTLVSLTQTLADASLGFCGKPQSTCHIPKSYGGIQERAKEKGLPLWSLGSPALLWVYHTSQMRQPTEIGALQQHFLKALEQWGGHLSCAWLA